MNSTPLPPRRSVLLNRLGLMLLTVILAGCGRENVKVYRLAKDDSSSSPNEMAAPNQAGAVQPQLQWTLPAGWTEVPATEMRLASFKVQGKDGAQADVSVVPLPGMAGGDDANVNRWRGQVGLAEATPDELQKMAEQAGVGGQPAKLYDIAGHNPGSDSAMRILAVIQHHGNMTWFFKMTGDSGLVEQQKPAFVAFLKSLEFTAAAQPDELPPGHPPIGGTDMNVPMGGRRGSTN